MQERAIALEVSPPAAVLLVGEVLEVQAIATFEGGRTEGVDASWSSSDPSRATVSAQTREVVGLFPGAITLTATSGGRTAAAALTVQARSTVARIEPATAHLLPGDTLALDWIAIDPVGAQVEGQPTWSSSDPDVAGVAPDGVVTARGTGSVTIRGEGEGIEATAHLVVSPLAPDRIEILAAERKLEVGREVYLEATVFDRDGQPMPEVHVQWTSESPTVVSVDGKGKALILRPAGGDVLALAGDAVGRIRLEGIIQFAQAVSIGAGSARSTCAVDGQGRAFCWGDNSYGQLGDGLRRPISIPLRVEWVPKLARIDAPAGLIDSAGTLRAFYGIAEDGRLVSWGQNAPEGGRIPLPYALMQRIERPWLDGSGAMPPHGLRRCDRTKKGALICTSDQGQDPMQMVREGSPLPLAGDPEPADEPIVEVAGAAMFCWRYEGGGVSCDASHGGQRRTQAFSLPGPARALAASRRSVCALLEGGAVHCWQKVFTLGWDARGVATQVLQGFTQPQQAEAPGPISALAGDYESICGATAGGWFCWKQHHAPSVGSSDWLGPPEPRGLPDITSYDPLSELGVDRAGILWHLGDPPTRAPGQR